MIAPANVKEEKEEEVKKRKYAESFI